MQSQSGESDNKIAFITGITGQDGAYLARFLLDKGYVVHGIAPYSATDDTERLKAQGLLGDPHFTRHHGDVTDSGFLHRMLAEIRPHEIYNLGAQSHVKVSFETPEATANINALGTLRLLEAIRNTGLAAHTRFYQAASSEMFGNAPSPQNEVTPLRPLSPYATSKLAAFWYVCNYRESYGLHASNGILFNHESPLRGEEFVTRKITRAVTAIEAGSDEILSIGNLEARRDWGHAQDYIEGMWRMLQQDKPDDYVLATGKAYSVRDFINTAFTQCGILLRWEGEGLDEKAYDDKTGWLLVRVDEQFFRPNELHELIGDAAKARELLGWQPRVPFAELVRQMLDYDRALIAAAGEGADFSRNETSKGGARKGDHQSDLLASE